MKKLIAIILAAVLTFSLMACAGQSTVSTASTSQAAAPESLSETTVAASQQENSEETSEQETETTGKKVAKDGANMQTDDPDMPTRVITEGTKVNIHFGDVVIPGILNDSETAQALIAKLPYTVHMNSYSHDFCGVTEELPYNEDEVHYGWLNGDIDYAIDAPYFTILHSDEDNSEQYGYQVNIGVITCELSKIRELSGSYDVLIELAEE